MLRPPRALEALWYERLKEDGFEDIEDVSREDRPLKSWQSWQFIEETRFQRKKRNEEYQSLADTFLHRQDFDEICILLVRHKGCKITSPQVRQAWELHCQGIAERQIAKELQRSKTAIHWLLTRLKTWMKLA